MQEMTHRAHVFDKKSGGGGELCLRTLQQAGPSLGTPGSTHPADQVTTMHRPVLILLSKPTDFLKQNVGKYGVLSQIFMS